MTVRIRIVFAVRSRQCSDFARRHRNSLKWGPIGAIQGTIQVYLIPLILNMLINCLYTASEVRIWWPTVARIGVSVGNLFTQSRGAVDMRTDRKAIPQKIRRCDGSPQSRRAIQLIALYLTSPRNYGPVRSPSAGAGGTPALRCGTRPIPQFEKRAAERRKRSGVRNAAPASRPSCRFAGARTKRGTYNRSIESPTNRVDRVDSSSP